MENEPSKKEKKIAEDLTSGRTKNLACGGYSCGELSCSDVTCSELDCGSFSVTVLEA
jgi:hypothetical protein